MSQWQSIYKVDINLIWMVTILKFCSSMGKIFIIIIILDNLSTVASLYYNIYYDILQTNVSKHNRSNFKMFFKQNGGSLKN